MDSKIKEGIKQIEKMYKEGNIIIAENAYPAFYRTYKDDLTEEHKELLANVIYTYSLESNTDLKEGFEGNVEFITNLLSQKDRSENNVNCFYTKSVLFVMKYYKTRDFNEVLTWSKKLNPELLSQEPESFEYMNKGIGYFNTDMEKWYGWKSTALLKTQQYTKTVKIIEEALEVIKFYSDNNKYWFKYRHALANRGIGNEEEALEELLDVFEYMHDWTVQNEIAYCYFNLDDNENAFKYALDAALNPDGGILSKSNVYELIMYILEEKELDELYEKHNQFLRHIRYEQQLTFEGIIDFEDEDETYEKNEYKKLENNLRKNWAELRYKTEERVKGKIYSMNKYDGSIIYDGEIYSFKLKTVDDNIKDILSIDLDVSFYKNVYYDKKNDITVRNAIGINLI